MSKCPKKNGYVLIFPHEAFLAKSHAMQHFRVHFLRRALVGIQQIAGALVLLPGCIRPAGIMKFNSADCRGITHGSRNLSFSSREGERKAESGECLSLPLAAR